jgi:hypothetical protein
MKWDFLRSLPESVQKLLLIAALIFSIAAFCAYFCKHTGIYTSLAFIFGGVCVLMIFYGDLSIRAGLVTLALIAVLGGAIYFLLFCAIAFHGVLVKQKHRKRAVFRRLEYTLPERSNSYVRTRLNTVLQVRGDEAITQGRAPLRLAHARKLLEKLKNAPLSIAERLQTDELSTAFSAYLHKTEWSTSDLRAINEMCSTIVKLSAKYGV